MSARAVLKTMRHMPEMLPPRYAILCHLGVSNFQLQKTPTAMPAITIPRLIKITSKLILDRILPSSSPYAAHVYRKRFRGRNPKLRKVDAVVIDTLRAKSAFMSAHHQFEYDPPGELTTMRSVIPTEYGKLNNITTAQPIKGSRPNWRGEQRCESNKWHSLRRY